MAEHYTTLSMSEYMDILSNCASINKKSLEQLQQLFKDVDARITSLGVTKNNWIGSIYDSISVIYDILDTNTESPSALQKLTQNPKYLESYNNTLQSTGYLNSEWADWSEDPDYQNLDSNRAQLTGLENQLNSIEAKIKDYEDSKAFMALYNIPYEEGVGLGLPKILERINKLQWATISSMLNKVRREFGNEYQLVKEDYENLRQKPLELQELRQTVERGERIKQSILQNQAEVKSNWGSYHAGLKSTLLEDLKSLETVKIIRTNIGDNAELKRSLSRLILVIQQLDILNDVKSNLVAEIESLELETDKISMAHTRYSRQRGRNKSAPFDTNHVRRLKALPQRRYSRTTYWRQNGPKALAYVDGFDMYDLFDEILDTTIDYYLLDLLLSNNCPDFCQEFYGDYCDYDLDISETETIPGNGYDQVSSYIEECDLLPVEVDMSGISQELTEDGIELDQEELDFAHEINQSDWALLEDDLTLAESDGQIDWADDPEATSGASWDDEDGVRFDSTEDYLDDPDQDLFGDVDTTEQEVTTPDYSDDRDDYDYSQTTETVYFESHSDPDPEPYTSEPSYDPDPDPSPSYDDFGGGGDDYDL